MKSKIVLLSATILAALSLLLPSGCISEFTADLPIKEDDILVVTGDIIENTEVEFVLSKSFSINTANPPSESQNVVATVTVVGSDGSQSQPATSLDKGVYRLAVGELKNDVAYGVRIEYYGNVYTSELAKPLRTPEIDEISFIQKEEYGDVYLRVSTHDDTSPEPVYYMWNYLENWEYPAHFHTLLYVNASGMEPPRIDTLHYNYRHYCWKKNKTNKLLVASTETLIENRLVNKQILDYPSGDDRFTELYCLTLTQKAISKAAYVYYSAKKTENEDMGGIFTPQPNEVKGNITCQSDPSKRTIGFVSVLKNVARKRLFIDRSEITREAPGCELFSVDVIFEKMAKEDYKGSIADYLYENKLEPVGNWEIGELLKFNSAGYTHQRCVDCVIAGGTKDKPDFWPNDHK